MEHFHTPLLQFVPMKHRMLRVNEVVKRELSTILTREINFESALVTINHVEVSPDLKTAQVFVSVLGSENSQNVMSKLEANRLTLQAELARRVTMKFTPHLLFQLDESIARGSRVIEILREIESPREKE
jgi:ribosome-binding factor A